MDDLQVDHERAVRASHHLLLGYGLSMQALRAASPGPVRAARCSSPARWSPPPTAWRTSPPPARSTATAKGVPLAGYSAWSLLDNFALGFETSGLRYPFLGADAFGHPGVAGAQGFADPASGVAYGYDKRFGLVNVDYATQRRTVKTSGLRYADLIAHHREPVRG